MNIALFDFDGTITDNDNFTAFCLFATTRMRKILVLPILLPVFLAYKLKLISSSRTRIIVSFFAFRGYSDNHIRDKGAKFADKKIPPHIRREALERIMFHKARGDTITAVSASLDAYLAPWAAAEGLRIICTVLESKNGRLTGRYLHGDCTGDEKVTRVKKEFDLAAYDRIYVYGDTSEDREMLALGNERYYRWKRIDDIQDHRDHRR